MSGSIAIGALVGIGILFAGISMGIILSSAFPMVRFMGILAVNGAILLFGMTLQKLYPWTVYDEGNRFEVFVTQLVTGRTEYQQRIRTECDEVEEQIEARLSS